MKDVNNAQEVLDCYGEYAPKLPNNQSLDLFLYKREGINLALNGYATSQGDTPNGTTFPNIDQLANGAKMETTVSHELTPYQLFDTETYMKFPKGIDSP